MSPDATLRRVGAEEMDALRAALVEADLPVDDISEPGRLFFRLDGNAASVAWAGLELHSSDALIRSVVIGAQERGTGRGTQLVRELIDEARRLGISRLWLLTTSAASFFARFGFEEVSRDVVPEVIRATRGFRDICPASATCMSLSLD